MPDVAFTRTKIVATLGPACRQKEQIRALVRAGADVFRLNTAHAGRQALEEDLRHVRELEAEMGQPLAVLVDLAGPKIRLGALPGDEVECHEGDTFQFVRPDHPRPAPDQWTTTYPALVDELNVGDRVMLADGTVALRVEAKTAEAVHVRVVQGGVVRSRQGVHLPGVRLSAPAMTAADHEHARWAAEAGVDWVGLSFVRRPEEVRELKDLLRARGSAGGVVAKIETLEALQSLEAIVEAADAVMVARGDLGVETDLAAIALVQKQVIDTCRRLHRPVITATQMLESMQRARFPTRAEATDVANAILDGTDACMLSGETAVGQHPEATVAFMNRIAAATEPTLGYRRDPSGDMPAPLHPFTRAAVHGAAEMARDVNAALVVVASHSGATALAFSKRRLYVPTIGISDTPATLRRMCLYWGIRPLGGIAWSDEATMRRTVSRWALQHGWLSPGEVMVFLRGTRPGADLHNAVVLSAAE